MAQRCRNNRHRPIAEQHQILSRKLRGHFAYYGITGNAKALCGFRTPVIRCWWVWLSRRKRDHRIAWPIFNGLLDRYRLPLAVVVHSVYRRVAKP